MSKKSPCWSPKKLYEVYELLLRMREVKTNLRVMKPNLLTLLMFREGALGLSRPRYVALNEDHGMKICLEESIRSPELKSHSYEIVDCFLPVSGLGGRSASFRTRV